MVKPTRPRLLRPGDTLGIVAPASPLALPQRLAEGLARLQSMGFQVKLAPHLTCRHGYLAGTDEQRAADLMAMFEDRAINGIICLRGGYGTARLLPYLDYERIRAHPKVLVGYSDITALHLAFLQKARLVSFWGPMVTSDFGARLTDFTRFWFEAVIGRSQPAGTITNPEDYPVYPLVPGRGRGPVTGGNLSLLVSSLGTPYEIETGGRILFIEEVGEEPYRIDRMLTQLRLAGKLDQVAGVVIGECIACRPRPHQSSFSSGSFSLEEVLKDRLADLGVPVLYGLCIGHGRHRATLPMGIEATLDTAQGGLTLEEAAVRPG